MGLDELEADGLSGQHSAEWEWLASEAEEAFGIDAPRLHRFGVLGRAKAVGHGPRRRMVTGRGSLLPERLVGAHVVVDASEAIEDTLLLEQGGLRWGRGLGLERAVHSLVTAVLLRLPRLDALGEDAELDPPDAQRAEATQSVA